MLYGIFILFFALLLARNFYALEDKKGTEFVPFFFFLVSKTVPFCTWLVYIVKFCLLHFWVQVALYGDDFVRTMRNSGSFGLLAYY